MRDTSPGISKAGGLVDIHCHVASTHFIPPPFVRGVAENMAASLQARGAAMPAEIILDRSLERLRDPDCEQLIREMDDAGIEHAVLLIADFTYVFPDCTEAIEKIFERHRDLARRHPDRFSVFGGVDPRWGRRGIDLFARAVDDWGFAGLKVYPPCGFGPSDPAMFPLYEICRERGLPVLLHFGPTSPSLSFEHSSPFTLDGAARAFPQVPFIIAHGGANHVEEAALMCEYRPNVYLDLSGLQTRLGQAERLPWHRQLFFRGINHKILFGTDWPLFRMQGTQLDFVTELRREGGLLDGVSDADRELIFAGNARRLLSRAGAGRSGDLVASGQGRA